MTECGKRSFKRSVSKARARLKTCCWRNSQIHIPWRNTGAQAAAKKKTGVWWLQRLWLGCLNRD